MLKKGVLAAAERRLAESGALVGLLVIVGVDPDPASNERMIEWARNYWTALHPYSAGGGYINMMMDEGEDSVRSAYRDNYGRLAQLKRKYDPGNLFRINQNIKP